jgi:uncharacterized protein (TIGR03067 family)
MGTDPARPENQIAWHIARRRRMVRDLVLTAVGVGGLVLLGLWTGWNVEPVIGALVVAISIGLVHNYRLYRAEKRVAERLTDGVTVAWKPLSVVVDGRVLPVGYSAMYMLVTGDRYEVLVNGRRYETGTSQVVADGEVRQTEVLPDTGRRSGQSLAQISRVDGDVLTACAAGPDAPRPTAFSSTPGSGHTLSVWLRMR